MKLIKYTACFLSAFSMSIAPLAQGAEKLEEKKQLLNLYLKETGISTDKNLTVSQYWKSVRHVYPAGIRNAADAWVARNRDMPMPKVQAVTFKDKDNVEQIRLSFTSNGETNSVTFTGNEDFPIKLNSVSFSKKELAKLNIKDIASKLNKEDPTLKKAITKNDKQTIFRKDIVVSFAEFQQFTALQRAEYLIRLRQAMEASLKVYEKYGAKTALNDFNEKHKWAYQFLTGFEADAAGATLTGKRCVVAGYLSTYGENQSCGGEKSGRNDLQSQMNKYQASCSNAADVPCNPLVYGFKGGTEPYCVARADIKYATSNCNKQSPMNGADDVKNKKRIIESFLNRNGKNIDLKFNDEGKISQEQYNEIKEYLTGLNGLINDAKGLCEGDAGFAKIKKQRPDQDDACNALLTRAFDLQSFVAAPVPPTPIPPVEPPVDQPVPDKCGTEKVGSVLAADGKTCQCPENTEEGEEYGEQGSPRQGQRYKACVPIMTPAVERPVKPAPPGKPAEECGFFCRNSGWLIAIAVGLGIWWLFSRDKKPKSPTYVPPANPNGCIAPLQLINGVCQTPSQPPVVVPPPTAPPTEGGSGSSSTSGGGVR